MSTITTIMKGDLMIKGYSKNEMGRLCLGTHLGDFSKEVSEKYQNAITYALQHGIMTIDGAINYRGMCSEKDEGIAISNLIQMNLLKREDFCITSKAGLLFGDIQSGLNPQKYLTDILIPKGISRDDFFQYKGLYQTLDPAFFEIALEKTLENLNLQTLDVHYIHIPEIARLYLTEKEFYDKMEHLFAWYEKQVQAGKIRYYGIAVEFLVEEPQEVKWHFEIEKLKFLADQVSNQNSHFKYVLFEYNLLCPYAKTVKNQTVYGQKYSFADACKMSGLKTVASMPFAMGDGFQKYTAKELLLFSLNGADHVIVGSKNTSHIKEILAITSQEQ